MTLAGRLHQFVPTLDQGAVGSHILEIQRVLRASGWESEVFSEDTQPPYKGAAHHFTAYGGSVPAHPGDVVFYHLAIGSPVADWLLDRRPQRLAVYSHNITPPAWFAQWEPELSYRLAWGQAQLRQLARRCHLGIGVSEYNTRELQEYGCPNTAVLPILLDTAGLGVARPEAGAINERTFSYDGHVPANDAHSGAEGRTNERGSTWLFVGRLAPNKCQHEVIKAFALYRRVYDHSAQLWLVGGSSSERYGRALGQFAAAAGVADAVTLTGTVSTAELSARYADADVFVCLSEHEGFLVPLLEAWHHRLPVVAYAAAAVPETMGNGGLLLADKSPEMVAATAARMCRDPALRESLVTAGLARLEQFALTRTSQRLLGLASSLAAGAFDRHPIGVSSVSPGQSTTS